jgi:predicted MFS family arabinose efflux permease
VLVSNLLTATQDIATDGLSVDIMKPEERGNANGLKVAGYRGGMIIGGGALLAAYDWLGWTGTFVVMASLIVVASLPVFTLREQVPAPQAVVETKPRVVYYLRRRGVGRILAILITYKLGDEFSTDMLKPFFVDLGLSLSDIGNLVGTIGFVAGLLGAVCGGALVNRLGRRQALVSFGFLQALTIGGYAIMALLRPSHAWLGLLCASEYFSSGMATAALFTCTMDWSSKETAATDYSVQASTVVVAKGIAALLAGFSAQHFGYFIHFSLATVLGVVSLITVFIAFPDPETIAGVTHPEEVPV